MISEKRGRTLLKVLDQRIGLIILRFFGFLLRIKGARHSHKLMESDSCLLVCFGAIGDLIILTAAAKATLHNKKVYLACSRLNYSYALMHSNFYSDIECIDLKSPLSIYRCCKKFNVKQIIDSTQWANIGPIMIGLARLLDSSIFSRGFKSKNANRNLMYEKTTPHSNKIHEAGNFINLIVGDSKVTDNKQLSKFFPELYRSHPSKSTRKVLLHMWPSGARAYLKEWPEAYWQELARILINEGYQVYLSGSLSDAVRTQNFIQRTNLPLVNIAGIYDLKSLLDFLSDEIEFGVSVNTGILHLLVEAGVPAVGVHGPTNPDRWGPLGSASISLLPQSGPSAYLNYGFEYPKSDANAYSLDNLSVDQVVIALEDLRSRDNQLHE